MHSIRKRISLAFLRENESKSRTEHLDADLMRQSTSQSSGIFATFENFSHSVRKRLYKKEEAAALGDDIFAAKPQKLETPKKHDSLSSRVVRSLGHSSRKKGGSSRKLMRQQERGESPESPSTTWRSLREASPTIATNIESGGLKDAISNKLATANSSERGTTTIFAADDVKGDVGAWQALNETGRQTPAWLGFSIAQLNVVSGPPVSEKGIFAVAAEEIEPVNHNKHGKVAKRLWPDVTQQDADTLATSAAFENLFARSHDDPQSDSQAQCLSDDKGYSPDTESNTEDPSSESVSPAKCNFGPSFIANLSESSEPLSLASHHNSKSQITLSSPKAIPIRRFKNEKKGRNEVTNLSFDEPYIEPDSSKVSRESSTPCHSHLESYPLKHLPEMEKDSSAGLTPQRMTSEMYEADGESSEANAEVPSMGSREEWQRSRADRNRRYLAVSKHEDSTDTDEYGASELDLAPCEAPNAANSDGEDRPPFSEARGKSPKSEPSSRIGLAVEKIRDVRGSASNTKRPTGKLHYYIEAIGRQNGKDLEESGQSMSQWLSIPFYDAMKAFQRYQLSKNNLRTKVENAEMPAEDFDRKSSIHITRDLASFAHSPGIDGLLGTAVGHVSGSANDERRHLSAVIGVEQKETGSDTPPGSELMTYAGDGTDEPSQSQISSCKPRHQFLVQHFQKNERDPSYCSSSRQVELLAKRDKKGVCFANDVEIITRKSPSGSAALSRGPSSTYDDEDMDLKETSRGRSLSSESSRKVDLAKELAQKEKRAFMRLAYKLEGEAQKENSAYNGTAGSGYPV